MASSKDYSPTAEIPQLDARRIRLIKKFDEGLLSDLGWELYAIAAEDLLNEGETEPKRNVQASMKLVEKDRHGAKEMMNLLCSISTPVIEALLWNTVGYRYEREADFRDQFYTLDGTSGVYMNTLVITTENKSDEGKGLSRRQWKTVRDMIKRYMDGHKISINIDSSQEEIDAAKEAETIDNAWSDKGVNQSEGDRYFINKGDASLVFLKKLDERIRKDIDKTGENPQIQFPLEVGCATKLMSRMVAYCPENGLTQTPKPWGLLLSCLKVLGIPFKVISLPILKIWKPEQYKLAEILVTMLAGAMVYDGGFNPKQSGTNNVYRDEDHNYRKEIHEVFIQRPWLRDNIDRDQEGLRQKRLAKSKNRTQVSLEDIKAKIESMDDPTKIRAKMNETKKKLEEATAVLERSNKALKAQLDQAEEELDKAEREYIREKEKQRALSRNIKKWLEEEDEVEKKEKAESEEED